MQSDSYTSIFGVGLLDDLHNYFPDLLYSPRRFSSTQDVLQYVQDQTRSRFNLLDYGRRIHREQETAATVPTTAVPATIAGTTVPVTATGTTVPVTATGTAGTAVPVTATGTAGTAVPVTAVPVTTVIPPTPLRSQRMPRRQHTFFYEVPPAADDMAGMNILTSLFNNLIHPPAHHNFTDVVVYPTNQQIDNATTVETLTATLEEACPICQEDLLAGSRVRRITRCNHPFHIDCIGHWFEQSCMCPICRTDIRGGQQP
jgi:hypothetical protein